MTIHSTSRRRFFWAIGREFRYRDLSPNDPDGDDMLPFGHLWLGFFTLAKDTGKPWWRGWTFRWNRD